MKGFDLPNTERPLVADGSFEDPVEAPIGRFSDETFLKLACYYRLWNPE
jgi:hypothetical protein